MSGIVSQLIEEYLSGRAVALKSKERAEEEPDEEETDEVEEVEEDDDDESEDGDGKRVSGVQRFVVNTDLIVAGPETEGEAEQLVGSLVQRLVKRGEIAEALILSADPE